MSGTFLEISDDVNKYLDLNQLTTVSLTSTSSLFRGLNNLKYNRFNPSSNIDIFGLVRQLRRDISTDDVKRVLRAFKSLENFNIMDCYQRYLVKNISAVGNTELLKYLVKAGADVNLGNPLEQHIIDSEISGNLENVEILIKAGYDVNSRDHTTTDLKILDLLIKGGLDLSFKNVEAKKPHFLDDTHVDYGINYDIDVFEENLGGLDRLFDVMEASRFLINAGASLEKDDMKMRTRLINILDNSKIFEFLEDLYGIKDIRGKKVARPG